MNRPDNISRKQLLEEAAYAAAINTLRGTLQEAFDAAGKSVEIEVSGAPLLTRIQAWYSPNRYRALYMVVTRKHIELYNYGALQRLYPNAPAGRKRAVAHMTRIGLDEIRRLAPAPN